MSRATPEPVTPLWSAVDSASPTQSWEIKEFPPLSRPQRTKRGHGGVIVMLALLAVGGWYLARWLNQPGHSQSVALTQTTSKAAAASAEPATFNLAGHYFGLDYPSSMRVSKSQPDKGALESINLVGRSRSNLQLSVSVYRGSLSEDSGVKMRRIQNKVYAETAITVGGVTCAVFERAGSNWGEAAFCPQNGLITSIAMADNQDQSAIFEQVLASLELK